LTGPTTKHQWTLGGFYSRLNRFVLQNELGLVFLAPLDVYFTPHNIVQPDVALSGGILMSLGNAVWHRRPLGLLGAAALLVFFDAKAGREERWLEQRFPEYPAYRRRTKKLVPGMY
jgi:hypothetical protein